MSAYLGLTRSITVNHNDRIRSACNPILELFGLNHFYYYKVWDSGHITFLGSNAEWCEYFASEKLYLDYPYIRHPDYFQNATLLVSNEDISHHGLKLIHDLGKEKFNFKTNLKLIFKTANSLEAFGFCSSKSNEKLTSNLITEMPLIRLFCDHFKQNNEFLFSKLEEQKIDLLEIIGPSFYENNLQPSIDSSTKKAFLEKLGITLGKDLSNREIDTTKLVLRGHSAERIALFLGLSKRTVEHHLERIKLKLHCHSKAELIEKARELERVGYLCPHL